MIEPKFSSALGPALTTALEKKGFTQLTAVQEAVLDPALEGRDLRITSQTGSGKTLAIGFALRELVKEPCPAQGGVGRPRALVIEPTRELAQQVEAELRWLYAQERARAVVSVTGGASYRDERRALGTGPAVVVGTPGRVLDHLRRGLIDATGLQAIVLDEADRMLDLGFREELEAIFGFTPKGRRTHLVSATFPRPVRALADSVQDNAAHVEGTRLGAANTDIDHVVHIIDPQQKLDALINLLLRHPDAQTLVFARTRLDVSQIAAELARAGFEAGSLSGEMDQAARNRTLAAFKRGTIKILVATDVAARGIDVQDISRVIHAELPTNADSYTHRSGRTGRAGRKGESALLVTPNAVVHAARLLRMAGVAHRFEPIPSAEAIRKASDERIVAELASAEPETDSPEQARLATLAQRLLETGDPVGTVTRLLAMTRYAKLAQPREVRSISANQARGGRDHERGSARAPGARDARDARDTRDAREPAGGWVPFRVSWGGQHGADARRLLAMVCRRGEIRGKDVGAIRVERTFCVFDVASAVAESFEKAAAQPDAREPRVIIRRDTLGGPHAQSRAPRPPQRRFNTPRPKPGAARPSP
jgi:ATP-dependent RNA helicase DeaD